MKTEDVLNLDYREEESKNIIQNVLRQLKPLSKYSDEEEVPIDALEKVIRIMTRKYLIRIRSIMPDIWSNKDNDIWRCEIVNDKNLELIKNIYGISLYEVLAKTAILMYSEIKKERLKVRE